MCDVEAARPAPRAARSRLPLVRAMAHAGAVHVPTYTTAIRMADGRREMAAPGHHDRHAPCAPHTGARDPWAMALGGRGGLGVDVMARRISPPSA